MVKFALAALAILLIVVAPSAHGSEMVLLDFSSPFCGPCQQMKPTIQSLQSAGYPIRPVDVTTDPELAAKYQVTQVPCFVLVVDGQEAERLVGSTSAEELQRMFQRATNRLQRDADQRVRSQSPDVPQSTGPASSPWMGVAGQPRSAPARAEVRPAGYDRPLDTQPSSLAPQSSSDESQHAELLSASVRIRVDDSTGRSFGTGTIIDARAGEALVVTCGHLFRESQGRGPVAIELFEAAPSAVRVAGEVSGQVISYNLDRDVALLSIRPGRPVNVASIAPPKTQLQRGDRVASVGCDHGQDPTVLPTRVTSLDRYQGPPNIEAAGAPVEGRSGGGLFNPQGQLIGVCFAADYEANEGLYVAVEAIHDELRAAGLSDIVLASAPIGGELAAAGPADMTPVVRGQEPLQRVMPPFGQSNAAPPPYAADTSPGSSTAAAPAGLNPVEQAAWEEIMTRAATCEVICIIRPKQPGGRSEVITLDDVSPEFVQALADRQREVSSAIQR